MLLNVVSYYYIEIHTNLSCRVEAIYPVHDPTALRDARVKSLIQYAMKVLAKRSFR